MVLITRARTSAFLLRRSLSTSSKSSSYSSSSSSSSPLPSIIGGIAVTLALSAGGAVYQENSAECATLARRNTRANTIQENYIDNCIGNTKLVYLKSLSEETKCKIYGKAEYQNPSGSVKDRTVMGIIQDAERSGRLQPGGTIVEGTGGNTGISLAQLGASKGYKIILTAPSNVSQEKIDQYERFGAEIHLAPSGHTFDHPDNYARKAEKIVAATPGALYANQFENLANYRVHFSTTGPEIYSQTNGAVDAFVCSSGTGGTIGGVSSFLKMAKPDCKVFLIDPTGSVLFDYVTSGKTKGAQVRAGQSPCIRHFYVVG